ncbi:MAG: hypothetical protein A2W85_12900 [Bacteroidetes bacterium GWF2_41_31]|nr:MAG: hypothetical protein A2W85_12900 [Bacteroidetes bacterium GWF2_41_31]
MVNFTVYNPVRLVFGNQIKDELGPCLKKFGMNILLIYGKGSVKKYGYYNQIMNVLASGGFKVTEFSGIKPNPVINDVRAAVKLGKEKKVDVVLALGGGSVIDSAKIVSLGLQTEIDPWEFMTWRIQPEKATPLVTILTLAATGSEMNSAAVIQNHETGEKLGLVNELLFPKTSFLNPEFTLSVPKNYTAFGIVDLIAHSLESYFGEGEPSITDSFTFSIIKDAMRWAPKLLNNLDNLEYRANIMLDATLALNGITSYGKKGGDWGVHAMGHELSLLFDTPHGASLSIAYPAWLKLHKKTCSDRISKLGDALFDTSDVDETIEKLTAFFASVGSPVKLSEINVNDEQLTEIVAQYHRNKVSGMHHKLSKYDHQTLVTLMI